MRSLRSFFVLITGLMLALATISVAIPASAQGGGFHGDVKIHQEPSGDEPIVRNEPQVCSPFSLHGFGFDASAHGWWKIIAWQPTGNNSDVVLHADDWGPASASGEWSSGNLTLDPGHYKLEFEQTNPAVPGNVKHKAFWVKCATEGSGIRIWKYNDLNNNGSWEDETEPGLAGWSFTIAPAGGQGTPTDVQTNASGQAYVDVPAGNYVVSEKLPLPAFWTNTQPGGATPHYDITVAEGAEQEVMFGNRYFQPLNPTPTPTPPGTLQIIKYNDLDRNATRGSTEPALAGFSFQVKAGANVVATITTSTTGIATLTLLPGVYSASEVAATGWVNTDPGGAAPTKTVTITSGETSTLVFGNATVIIPPTSQTEITIVKYSDANGNGKRDNGEGALSGFTFVVKASDGSVVGTATTGADGTATVVGLPLGPYTITETPLTGWTNTDPGGAGIKVAVLSANATTATVSFGNAQIRLPSTSTEDGTTNGLLALILAGAGVAMLVVARRTSQRT